MTCLQHRCIEVRDELLTARADLERARHALRRILHEASDNPPDWENRTAPTSLENFAHGISCIAIAALTPNDQAQPRRAGGACEGRARRRRDPSAGAPGWAPPRKRAISCATMKSTPQ